VIFFFPSKAHQQQQQGAGPYSLDDDTLGVSQHKRKGLAQLQTILVLVSMVRIS
jgi:hypothetical protein